MRLGSLEANSVKKLIEIVHDFLIEAIQLGSFVVLEFGVSPVRGDLTTEDAGDLAGPADGAVGIQQSVVQAIECGAPVKDQVVAILHLGEKEPVLTAASFAFAVFKERSQTG